MFFTFDSYIVGLAVSFFLKDQLIPLFFSHRVFLMNFLYLN